MTHAPPPPRPERAPGATSATPATLATLAALAPFGLTPAAAQAPPAPPDVAAALAALAGLRAGQAALLSAPSGCGKSRLLRALAPRLPGVCVRTGDPPPPARRPRDSATLIDALAPLPLPRRLDLLARLGLAEPRLFARPPDTLSQGQRARADLAAALAQLLAARAPSPDTPRWLLADEFLTPLDRHTAAAVAHALRRWLDREGPAHGLRLLAAAAHEDVPALLRPHLHLSLNDAASLQVERHANAPPPALAELFEGEPRIVPGTIDDYAALAGYHYRAGPPATVERVLRVQAPPAARRAGLSAAAVLVTSRPTRCGVWRNLAWPGRYAGTDHAAALRRLNDEVRCISRVVVHPRYRALGLATRLVRAYLENPATPCTEAVAAMGAVSPFFAAAGMVAYALPRRPSDQRLLDALDEAGVPAEALLDDRVRARLLASPTVVREIGVWAAARFRPRAPGRGRGASESEPPPVAAAFLAAAVRLSARPVAFAHTAPAPGEVRAPCQSSAEIRCNATSV